MKNIFKDIDQLKLKKLNVWLGIAKGAIALVLLSQATELRSANVKRY